MLTLQIGNLMESLNQWFDPSLAGWIGKKISGKSIQECCCIKQLAYFGSNKVADGFFRRLKLAKEFNPPIDHSNEVFQVMARLEVAFASASECLQFCCAEVDRCNDPNAEPGFDLALEGCIHSRFIPSV